MEKTRGQDLLFLHSMPHFASREEADPYLLRYIETAFEVKGVGCRLVDINRRFGRAMKDVFTTPRKSVERLMAQDKLTVSSFMNNLLLYPTFQYQMALEASDTNQQVDFCVKMDQRTLNEYKTV